MELSASQMFAMRESNIFQVIIITIVRKNMMSYAYGLFLNRSTFALESDFPVEVETFLAELLKEVLKETPARRK